MDGPKKLTLELDPKATCRMETREGNWGRWAIVRDAAGDEIGKHRTTKGAWELALSVLRRKNKGVIATTRTEGTCRSH